MICFLNVLVLYINDCINKFDECGYREKNVSKFRNKLYICVNLNNLPVRYFETIFLEDVILFLETLDVKTVRKILYNIDLAEQTNDATLFKKLQQDIWEFRTVYAGKQIRLLAFWDKRRSDKTLVISTNGLIKKGSKMPKKTIDKAIQQKATYFNHKNQ